MSSLIEPAFSRISRAASSNCVLADALRHPAQRVPRRVAPELVADHRDDLGAGCGPPPARTSRRAAPCTSARTRAGEHLRGAARELAGAERDDRADRVVEHERLEALRDQVALVLGRVVAALDLVAVRVAVAVGVVGVRIGAELDLLRVGQPVARGAVLAVPVRARTGRCRSRPLRRRVSPSPSVSPLVGSSLPPEPASRRSSIPSPSVSAASGSVPEPPLLAVGDPVAVASRPIAGRCPPRRSSRSETPSPSRSPGRPAEAVGPVAALGRSTDLAHQPIAGAAPIAVPTLVVETAAMITETTSSTPDVLRGRLSALGRILRSQTEPVDQPPAPGSARTRRARRPAGPQRERRLGACRRARSTMHALRIGRLLRRSRPASCSVDRPRRRATSPRRSEMTPPSSRPLVRLRADSAASAARRPASPSPASRCRDVGRDALLDQDPVGLGGRRALAAAADRRPRPGTRGARGGPQADATGASAIAPRVPRPILSLGPVLTTAGCCRACASGPARAW